MDLAFTAEGLTGRCQFVAGNLFQAVPSGGDIYTMKWILHDWPDEKAGAILRTIHQAMPEHGKLLVVEAIVPPGDDAAAGRLMDINMMVMCGGKERTELEWRALLDSNGFLLTEVISMPAPVSIIEAVKI